MRVNDMLGILGCGSRSGDTDTVLEQRALAAAIDQVEDAAAQNSSMDVEAAVQSTPDDAVVLVGCL
jgi:hypothetical protein